MLNVKTRALVAVGAPGLAGYLVSDGLSGEARASITGAAMLAGLAGGLAPDVLEPAIPPAYRSALHGAAFAAVVDKVGRSPLRQSVKELLTEAQAVRRQRLTMGREHPDHGRLWFEEFSRYFLAGFLIGAPVGYLSRVVRPRP